MSNDHKMLTFTSSTISSSRGGCATRMQDQSVYYMNRQRYVLPLRNKVNLAAALRRVL